MRVSVQHDENLETIVIIDFLYLVTIIYNHMFDA